jgi:queuine tRNA-ribosyltransferase
MWTYDAFARLFAACRGAPHPVGVYTYSVATPIRAALLAAGFFVGHGPRTGLKHETTQAATTREALAEPLGERWLLRWLRSHTRHPYDTTPATVEAMTHAVLYHPQFIELVYRTKLRDPRVQHRSGHPGNFTRT